MGNAFSDYLAAHGGTGATTRGRASRGGSNAFTDYLKYGNRTDGSDLLPKPTKSDTSGFGAIAPPAGKGQDFLSWAGDMLSRPLYAVTDTVKAVGDAGTDLIDPKHA